MTTPAEEQTAAADAFQAGHHLVLQAGAGTGKTTTLALLAAGTNRRGRYLAFNREIARAAATRFPRTVRCTTAHATAYAAVGHRYTHRLNGPRQPAWKIGQDLGITRSVRIGDRDISHKALSHTVLRTVTRFCHSADSAFAHRHVPPMRGLDSPPAHTQLVGTVLPFAAKAWADLQNPDKGVVRFEHDHYLKIWALTKPRIEAGFLLLDEAQDTNPVLEQVFTAQRDHAQLVMVGDSAQAIYGWRGAQDVLSRFDGVPLTLTRSFRFGPHLAEQANRWLALADAPIRLSGSDSIATDVGTVTHPQAVLSRTNVGAMAEVMRQLSEGHRVALVGGGQALRALALAARDLKEGRRTPHPELTLFTSWGDLQDYADHDPSGGDLQPLVDLVDQHGPDAILNAVEQLTDETSADVTVSTAHKAKGREWSTVRIADDFPPPRYSDELDAQGRPIPEPVKDTDARLAYVAVTRARHQLDLGGLSWIDDHPSSLAPSAPPTPATDQQPPARHALK
ncbi:UvrD-helicase domain-containing protein [Streptomyces sp. NPDC001833]|uniref:UvrD-helicase domain-containing protein n=1 Tax=Streptomyces sp. NPDC001833 TaxID=3154658 RepID=UPI00332EB757